MLLSTYFGIDRFSIFDLDLIHFSAAQNVQKETNGKLAPQFPSIAVFKAHYHRLDQKSLPSTFL